VIILVRHAMPKLEPGVDPAQWTLSDDGLAAARSAGHLLPAGAVLVSSDEPKAHATLTAMVPGRPLTLDRRLREVARPVEPFDDDFRSARLAYVAGDPPDGWEPSIAVAARIDAAITDHQTPGRPLVLAGHGMAFTTWLSAHRLIADPRAFWSDLRLPDLVLVRDATVRRLV
jgi:broad specificity phosphatase PhoE